jgi:hypothetical protein
VPLPVEVLVVPSLHVVVAPLAGAAAGAAAGAGAELELEEDEAFCTPPWPLQAPRPVACEVVPSLHVVGAVLSARAAVGVRTNSPIEAAITPASIVCFIV